MKSWFWKFRISVALDERRPVASLLRSRIGQCPELQQFEKDTARLSSRLGPPPSTATPLALHESIMRRVRAAQVSSSEMANSGSKKWVPISAGASILVLAAGLFLALNHRHGDNSQVAGKVSLNSPFGLMSAGSLDSAASTPAVAPLTQEWQYLKVDFDNTANFLAASLP